MDVQTPETEANPSETLIKLIGVLKRRWVSIIAIACAISIAADIVLILLPNRYTSEATLLVVQQQVPERYVIPTTSTSLADALQAMKEEVLSRTRLLEIIGDFHLYVNERKRLPPEQVVELVRRNIAIQPLNAVPERPDFNAFKISFTADTPRLAQDVTARLTSLFIEANLRTREDQAKNTTNFLSEQLKVVANRLAEQEERLRDYKMRHLGELPEQQQGNVAILSGLQSQLQNTAVSLSRAQQQRVYFESLLNDYRRGAARGTALPTSAAGGRSLTPLQAARTELARLQAARNDLLSRYTAAHPDVKRADADIERQQQLADSLKESESSRGDDRSANEKPNAAVDPEDDVSIMQIKSQLAANQLEIQGLINDQKRLKAAVDDYQNRLEATPVTEQQLAGVLRDYDLLKKEYADLLNKQEQSQLATSLEKQQEGQQFRLVDSPSLPSVPSSPKRLKMSVGGLAGGIFLGLALAFLREMRNPAFHTEEELQKRFRVRVVGVPLFITPREQRSRFWRNAFECTAASVLVLAALGAELMVYRWS
jgi:polysaccharide chain length determinant protein (PEP-CTERM system associated)